MNKRRIYNSQNTQKYQQLQKDIRGKIRQAEDKQYEKRCKKIEDLDGRYDMFNLHNEVKELADILQKWKEYMKELFMDNREDTLETYTYQKKIGPDNDKKDVKHALNNMKKGRSLGPDQVTSDISELIVKKHTDILVTIFNKKYRTGNIPKKWLISTFICLPKRSYAQECSDHRTISMISYTLKLLHKVTLNLDSERYADDTVILAESIEDLQRLMNKVSTCSEEYGLSPNTKRTKFIVIPKNNPVNVNLTREGRNVGRVG
ncbi:hypothetical protein JTB14_012679 [Gonioctena quinquepunctata]|nr:hypothetical protein JTB14_012679 [Gonioctena quinquepunctata]